MKANRASNANYQKGLKSYTERVWKVIHQYFGKPGPDADKILVASYRRGLEAYEKGDYATALREWEPLSGQGVSKYNLMAGIGRQYIGTTDINYQIRNTEIVEVAKSLYKDLDPAD